MPIALVGEIARRFIGLKQPETLAITGKWGVGKTHAWNSYVRSAMQAQQFALTDYSYVSLFGPNSIDEVKRAIFASTVSRQVAGVTSPTIQTFAGHTGALVKSMARKNLPNAKYIPKFKDYSGLLSEIALLSISETLICLDDLERRGKSLRIRDLLGLVTLLRETRSCKVVILANVDELEKDPESVEFTRLLEKTIDRHVVFSPSPEEAVDIALEGVSEARTLIREFSPKLGITNIRIIKRIETNAIEIENALQGLDRRILCQAIKMTTLFTWCLLRGDESPTIDFVTGRALWYLSGFNAKADKRTDEEKEWSSLLTSYSLVSLDNFDGYVLDCIRSGIFETVPIREAAQPLVRKFEAGDRGELLNEAWRIYHYSLRSNQQAVTDKFVEAARVGGDLISASALNSAVSLLLKLGEKEAAVNILDLYAIANAGNDKAFDISDIFLHNDHISDLVRDDLEARQANRQLRPLRDVFFSIANYRGHGDQEIETLKAASLDDIRVALDSFDGDEGLMTVIRELLKFRSAIDHLHDFGWRLALVLRTFAAESGINALRLARFGVAPLE